MPQYIVCLSVRPSVTFMYPVYRDQTVWNSSKITSWPNNLRLLLELTRTWVIWCNGNNPRLGWNSSGVTQEPKQPGIYPRNGTR